MATTKEPEHLAAALKRFGWECGPEFEKRYVTDPWVFNLANAVDNLTYENEAIKAFVDDLLADWEADEEQIFQEFGVGADERKQMDDEIAARYAKWAKLSGGEGDHAG